MEILCSLPCKFVLFFFSFILFICHWTLLSIFSWATLSVRIINIVFPNNVWMLVLLCCCAADLWDEKIYYFQIKWYSFLFLFCRDGIKSEHVVLSIFFILWIFPSIFLTNGFHSLYLFISFSFLFYVSKSMVPTLCLSRVMAALFFFFF